MTAIHWPAWVICNEDRAPRPNASPAPALLVQPESPLVAHVERDGNEPEGSIGWIGDAPVYVDDGKGARATEPETHGKPRLRIVTPEQAAQELAQAKTQAIAALNADVERHIESRYTPTQQRLLTAIYARAVGKGQAAKLAKVEGMIDWVEEQALHLYDLVAQVQAAHTVEAVQAVRFDVSQFPPPQHSARDVLTTRE